MTGSIVYYFTLNYYINSVQLVKSDFGRKSPQNFTEKKYLTLLQKPINSLTSFLSDDKCLDQ